jgi:hypothetical protein
VQFETGSGREITFRGATGSSHPIDERGEIVQVICDPADLERFIIDRGVWNWRFRAAAGYSGH